MESTHAEQKKHPGSCHCGAVRYEVTLDASKGTRCNCTICQKIGATSAIVKPEAFTLLSGEANLGAYEWGMKIGRRHFCKTCGVHCFSRGHLKELGGDYVSVNLLTLDDVDPMDISILHWDGRHNNWYVGPREAPWPIFTA